MKRVFIFILFVVSLLICIQFFVHSCYVSGWGAIATINDTCECKGLTLELPSSIVTIFPEKSTVCLGYVEKEASITEGFKKNDCEQKGGKWLYHDAPMGASFQPGYCYHPQPDEGKQCYENTECVSDCISTNNTDEEGYILGTCGTYQIDTCMPTIPQRTKSRNELNGGACI